MRDSCIVRREDINHGDTDGQGKYRKLPIFGGCDSSVRLGLKSCGRPTHPSTVMQRLSGEVRRGVWVDDVYPKIGRNTLILWKCGQYFRSGRAAQTIQHKLLMPHPSECGPEQAT